jgi:hypothetical protein
MQHRPAAEAASVDEVGDPPDVGATGSGSWVAGNSALPAEPLEHLGAEGPPGLHPLHGLLVAAEADVKRLQVGHVAGGGGEGCRGGGQAVEPARCGRPVGSRGRRVAAPPAGRGRAGRAEAELAERGQDVVDGGPGAGPGPAAEGGGGPVRRQRRRLGRGRLGRRQERAGRRRGHDALGEVGLERLATQRGAVVGLGQRAGAPGAGARLLRRGREHPQLVRGVREEADAAAAGRAVLAGLGAVARRVEPALEDAVREVAGVAAPAPALAEVRAGGARVVVPARVAPPRLLPRVREGALGPVVAARAGAPPDLELVHAELVAAVAVHARGHGRRLLVVRLGGAGVVARQVLPQRRQQVRRHLVAADAGVDAAHGDVVGPRRHAHAFAHHHHGDLPWPVARIGLCFVPSLATGLREISWTELISLCCVRKTGGQCVGWGRGRRVQGLRAYKADGRAPDPGPTAVS